MQLFSGIHWRFFLVYFALSNTLFGEINLDNQKMIDGPAANLFIESLLQAGVTNSERQKDIVKLHVEELTCMNPFTNNREAICAILANRLTLVPSLEISKMLMRVLHADGIESSPASVRNIQCLRPSFPFPLGACTYFVD